MRIKKHHNKNEYLLTPQGLWVRNFHKPMVPYVDINNLVGARDHFTLLKNEYRNAQAKYPWADTERFSHEKVVIVSDGYGFADKHLLLEKLPVSVAVIATHGALAKWACPRSPNYYVVNNPYPECLRYLPGVGRPAPRCVASTRTNADFLLRYRGAKYRYIPVSDANYKGTNPKESAYQIDDYRNPICAAVGLAWHFGANKLLLLCCDDAFDGERPGAEQLPNGRWVYPPQHMAHGLIDGSLYWLKHNPYHEVQVWDHSAGPVYANATYIEGDTLSSLLEGWDV